MTLLRSLKIYTPFSNLKKDTSILSLSWKKCIYLIKNTSWGEKIDICHKKHAPSLQTIEIGGHYEFQRKTIVLMCILRFKTRTSSQEDNCAIFNVRCDETKEIIEKHLLYRVFLSEKGIKFAFRRSGSYVFKHL